jgi:hypothetical protein
LLNRWEEVEVHMAMPAEQRQPQQQKRYLTEPELISKRHKIWHQYMRLPGFAAYVDANPQSQYPAQYFTMDITGRAYVSLYQIRSSAFS